MATWGTPIEHGRFTAPFGQQRPTGVHLGTDIGPPRPGQTGVPVYAMGPGTVNRVGYTSIRGHWLLVVHDDGTYSRYQHLATAPTVGAGQRVQAATRVGTCGETGRATGIHLHLEAYPAGPNPGESQNGAINPETWASARGINLRALGALPSNPAPPTPPVLEEDNVMPIFMRNTRGAVYALVPGKPKRHLTPQHWTLWSRLGGTLRGGDFNDAEIDMINAQL
ncbi:M23 family metallopeptidase [Cellulomonas triticagri]|uniref:M23 family metallopeptidase n=1 Tax=Cellulomonas triticagri TaxID=2483352 RepID=A0A3M2JNJ0_9CELL|nr:M23 family metallopeptidase [Cellulomonas triticagri]RMI13390.1 M23 family metallopeptidase [Cellulomonas triticagri]